MGKIKKLEILFEEVDDPQFKQNNQSYIENIKEAIEEHPVLNADLKIIIAELFDSNEK